MVSVNQSELESNNILSKVTRAAGVGVQITKAQVFHAALRSTRFRSSEKNTYITVDKIIQNVNRKHKHAVLNRVFYRICQINM